MSTILVENLFLQGISLKKFKKIFFWLLPEVTSGNCGICICSEKEITFTVMHTTASTRLYISERW